MVATVPTIAKSNTHRGKDDHGQVENVSYTDQLKIFKLRLVTAHWDGTFNLGDSEQSCVFDPAQRKMHFLSESCTFSLNNACS